MKSIKWFRAITFALLVLLPLGGFAETSQRLVLESLLRDRVIRIVEKVDPAAIVQTKVVLKSVSSALPGMWFDAKVTPLAPNGDLGQESIDRIEVRVVTQNDKLPDWIQAEVKASVALDGVNVDVRFEKAKGEVPKSPTNPQEWLPGALKDLGKDFTTSFDKSVAELKAREAQEQSRQSLLLFACIAIGVGLFGVAGAIFLLGRKLDSTISRVIDEKLVPALSLQSRGGGGGGGSGRSEREAPRSVLDAKPMQIQLPSGGGSSSALGELPIQAIVALLADCYWTASDGYANFLWMQLSQKQREAVLASRESKDLLSGYFSYFRQFPAVDLNYHFDARYLTVSSAFNRMSQEDLAGWILEHSGFARQLTPMRWDFLPLSLADRLRLTNASDESETPFAGTMDLKNSGPRKLAFKFEVKQLSASDEDFVWKNPTLVPDEARGSMKTLSWLAMTSTETIKKTLEDFDARQLAEAWVGPAEVLAVLRATLTPRKAEMLDFVLKETKPDRDSESFTYLADVGLRLLREQELPAATARTA